MPGTLVPLAEMTADCLVLRLHAAYARSRDNGQTRSTTCLGSPAGTLLEEWMDDHQPHYESEPQRSPNVPTSREGGLPGFQATGWFGLFAPKDRIYLD